MSDLYADWEPLDEIVYELTPESVGYWIVLTMGSNHVWEISEDGTIHWTRYPGPGATSFGDEVARVRLTRVDWWPEVGEASLLWFDDLEDPRSVEQWRRSSTTLRIGRAVRREHP